MPIILITGILLNPKVWRVEIILTKEFSVTWQRRSCPCKNSSLSANYRKCLCGILYCNSLFEQYLEHRERNEFINIAAHIGFDERNIAFVFFENQVCKLMSENPCDEKKLEVLRALCSGQPRKMVNLFLATMKNVSTSQRIEKAIDRFRQRYGVSGGLTTEPQIIAVGNGPKVTFNSTSLKSFNEDLNTSEVFAYAHDEVEKLSGQLMLDVANRLLGRASERKFFRGYEGRNRAPQALSRAVPLNHFLSDGCKSSFKSEKYNVYISHTVYS